MERKNGIEEGVVLIQRTDQMTLLYSFATKSDGNEFLSDIQENTDFFYSMGDHCFNLIAPIYEKYATPQSSQPKTKGSSKIIQLHKNEKN
jgi:hypothetical protein